MLIKNIEVFFLLYIYINLEAKIKYPIILIHVSYRTVWQWIAWSENAILWTYTFVISTFFYFQIHHNFQKYPLFLQLFHSLALEEFAANTVIIEKEVFLDQLDSIDNAACSWISLMSGLSLNMYQGFRNEEDLLNYFKHEAYYDNVTVLASMYAVLLLLIHFLFFKSHYFEN